MTHIEPPVLQKDTGTGGFFYVNKMTLQYGLLDWKNHAGTA